MPSMAYPFGSPLHVPAARDRKRARRNVAEAAADVPPGATGTAGACAASGPAVTPRLESASNTNKEHPKSDVADPARHG